MDMDWKDATIRSLSPEEWFVQQVRETMKAGEFVDKDATIESLTPEEAYARNVLYAMTAGDLVWTFQSDITTRFKVRFDPETGAILDMEPLPSDFDMTGYEEV